MTGGTALSEFYFRHRLSEDLDFFSENKFNEKKLLGIVSNIGDQLKLFKIEQQNLTGQNTFYFYFSRNKSVKVDFSEFPFRHLGKFKKLNNLKISSIEDIATNKIHAITTRKRSRDYFDLYLCLNELDWGYKDMLKSYRLKFDVNLPIEQLATSYLNVNEAKDIPLFLGRNKWPKVKKYFLDASKKIGEEILTR